MNDGVISLGNETTNFEEVIVSQISQIDDRSEDQIKNEIEKHHSTELSGKEFKKIIGRLRLWRCTNISECHNGFQYRTGLNVDTKEFRPEGNCEGGGLYFCDETQIETITDYFQLEFVREVFIPDDARVWVMGSKYKADKFILGSREHLFSSVLFQTRLLDFLKIAWRAMSYFRESRSRRKKVIVDRTRWRITNPRDYLNRARLDSVTPAMLEYFQVVEFSNKKVVPQISELSPEKPVKFKYGIDFAYYVLDLAEVEGYRRKTVDDITYADALKLIEKDWRHIVLLPLEYLTDELCDLALRKNGRSIRYMTQTTNRCKRAVKNAPLAFEYVHDRHKTEKLSWYAIRRNFDNYRFVPESSKTPKIVTYMAKKLSFLVEADKINKSIAIALLSSKNKKTLSRLPDSIKDSEFIARMIETNPALMAGLSQEDRTTELCYCALATGAPVLKYVPKDVATDAMIEYAIDMNPKNLEALREVREVTKWDRFIRFAIRDNPMNIAHAPYGYEHLSTKDYTALIKRDYRVIEHIPDNQMTYDQAKYAINQDPHMLQHLNNNLRNRLFDMACDIDPTCVKYADHETSIDLKYIEQACKIDPQLIGYLRLIQKSHYEFALMMIRKFPALIRHFGYCYYPHELELQKEALRADPDSLKHMYIPVKEIKEYAQEMITVRCRNKNKQKQNKNREKASLTASESADFWQKYYDTQKVKKTY